ncbi:MAG: DUF3899 domain-containing protein [Treponema sp.]|nr:DUF3899 domain-containing protein [Treponema sp.]
MKRGAVKKFLLLISAFLLALLVMRWESSTRAAAGEELPLSRIWSDGFFVSAALFASVGILSLIAGWGGFDTLAYGAGFLAARFTRRDSAYKSYFDYVQAKSAERKARADRLNGNRNANGKESANGGGNVHGKGTGRLHPLDFIITGLVMLALSALAMLAQ